MIVNIRFNIFNFRVRDIEKKKFFKMKGLNYNF